MTFQLLNTNEHGDWISLRNSSFDDYFKLEPEKKFDTLSKSFFIVQGPGILSSRDAWVYNFSIKSVEMNMQKMISFYNEQKEDFKQIKVEKPNLKVEDFINSDATKISWTRALRNDIQKQINHNYNETSMSESSYRPFFKMRLYYDKSFIESPGLTGRFLSDDKQNNRVIVITGNGSSRDFSTIITDILPTYDLIEKGQCFPLYYYEENTSIQKGLFDNDNSQDYIRRDAISDFIFERAKNQYGKSVSKQDIFYYVYGFLHNKDYRETFANDLKKMLPRLPLIEDVKDFWSYSKAGRKLAQLHLNYEEIEPYSQVVIKGKETGNFEVDKMRFPKKDQKDTIYYNSSITISNIPEKAFEYVVNGKSAIEWIMERYQKTTHKESGITNNPNDWATETGKPTYILDLILSIINVSIQTIDIVNDLPKVIF